MNLRLLLAAIAIAILSWEPTHAQENTIYLPALFSTPSDLTILGYNGEYFNSQYDVLVLMRNDADHPICDVQAVATVTAAPGPHVGDAIVHSIPAHQTFPVVVTVPDAPSGVSVIDVTATWTPCN